MVKEGLIQSRPFSQILEGNGRAGQKWTCFNRVRATSKTLRPKIKKTNKKIGRKKSIPDVLTKPK